MGQTDMIVQAWNRMPCASAPSTNLFLPVVKLAAVLARKTAALAISCGRPMRPVGFSASTCWKKSGLPCSMRCQTPLSNQVLPGETMAARMLWPASWRAQ